MVCGEDPRDVMPGWDQMAESENEAHMLSVYGAARWADVDPAFFRASVSPIAMAVDNVAAIRESGIQIFIDAGDEDYYDLHNAAELMHRVLWQQRIPHEYHLVRGGNHSGSSWRRRGPEAMDFLFRVMDDALPGRDPERGVGPELAMKRSDRVLSAEEAEWLQWVRNGGTQSGLPEPPCIGVLGVSTKAEFVGVGVFSDRHGDYVELVNMHRAGVLGGKLDEPASIMGHPWRAPGAVT